MDTINSVDTKDTMRIPCPYCQETLTSNSRKNDYKMQPVINKESHTFTSLTFCSNCGATLDLKIAIIPKEPPYQQRQATLLELAQ